MARNRKSFAAREERLAWKLLAPSLIALFVLAFYPLGQVFYTSLTDREFAGAKETSFVGLENYKKLLMMTIRVLPQKKDKESGAPVVDESGAPVYERAIRILPRKPVRYKELTQFSALGTRYVIGARDPVFMMSIFNTLVFTFFSVTLEVILGLGVALAVNSKFPGRGAMRAVMLVPWAVITVVSARIWEYMFLPTRQGMFNMLLSHLGLGDGQISFLTMESMQMPALVAVDVWKTTPFMALLLLAGLQLIPSDLYKAAEVDGAGPVRRFFSITLPLLRPALAVALIFRTLDALRVFDVFQVMLGSRSYSMASYNYELLIQYREMGMASAVGVVIFSLIAVFVFMYMRLMGAGDND